MFLLPGYVNDPLKHVVLVATCRTQKSHGLPIDMHYVIVLKGNHQLNREMKQQNINFVHLEQRRNVGKYLRWYRKNGGKFATPETITFT